MMFGRKKRAAFAEQARVEAIERQARHEPTICFTITDHGNGSVIWNVWDLDPIPQTQVEGYMIPFDRGVENTVMDAFNRLLKWIPKGHKT